MSAPNSLSAKMPGVIIRRLAARDVTSISALLAESPNSAQWSPESLGQFAGEGESGRTGWVAEDSGKLVGFITVGMAADEFEIMNLEVSEAFRRRGIASKLLDVALEFSRISGSRKAYLEVRASNAAAIAFYARRGFIECGRRRGYYQDPAEDALLFSRHVE